MKFVKSWSRRLVRSLVHELTDRTPTLEERHYRSTYGCQKGQVGFLLNQVFDYESKGLKRDGYFIDLAAGDGVRSSNTFFLEKFLGWQGILIEPNPNYYGKIHESRKSPLVTSPITAQDGEKVYFRIDNGYFGGIVSSETDNSPEVRGKELQTATVIQLESRSLRTVLLEHEAPTVIDFLSLDVEGSEDSVLLDFPFEEFRFRCMAIERPSKALDMRLDREGYRQVAHLHYDVIYVHESFLTEVNFRPKFRFAFTPAKNW